MAHFRCVLSIAFVAVLLTLCISVGAQSAREWKQRTDAISDNVIEPVNSMFERAFTIVDSVRRHSKAFQESPAGKWFVPGVLHAIHYLRHSAPASLPTTATGSTLGTSFTRVQTGKMGTGPRIFKSELRDKLLDNAIEPPLALAPISRSFMTSLPRYTQKQKSAPKRIPNLEYISSDNGLSSAEKKTLWDTPLQEYAEGVVSLALVPLVLMVLIIFFSCCFCWCRCCFCNCPGGRGPSQLYSKRQVQCAKFSMLLTAAILFTLAMLGYSSSVGFSTGLDEMRTTSLNTVAYGFDAALVANSSRSIGIRAVAIAKQLNHTVFDVFPSHTTINRWDSCFVNNTFTILDVKDSLITTLKRLAVVVDNLPNFLSLANVVLQMNTAKDALPDLSALQTELSSMNVSLYSLPNADDISTSLASLNSTLLALKRLDVIATKLQSLDTILTNFSSVTLRAQLLQYESAISLMPDLTVLHYNLSNPATQTSAEPVKNALVSLNNSVNAMPDAAALKTEITSMNTSINGVTASLTVADDVVALNATLASSPNLTTMGGYITAISSFQVSGAASFTRLVPFVTRINTSINLIPSMSVLLDLIAQANTSVETVKAFKLNATANLLITLNDTIPRMRCVMEVFTLVDTINDTLVQLPPKADEIVKVRTDVDKILNDTAKYQADITKGHADLLDVIKSLDDLPNFSNLTKQVKDFNTSIVDLPDMNKTLADIKSMNRTLYDVPELSQYTNQINEFQGTSKVSNLDGMVANIRSTNATIQSLPDLNTFVENIDTLNSTISGISPVITLAWSVWTVPAGLTDPLKSSILAKIVTLNTTIQTRPNATALVVQLDALNATMSTRPNITQIIADIRSLNDTITAFPDIDSLSGSVSSLKTIRSNSKTLDSLIGTSLLSDLNKTVKDLPDLLSTYRQVIDIHNSTDSLSLNSTISSLDIQDSFNRSDITDQIDNMRTLRTDMKDVDARIADMDDGLVDADTKWIEAQNAKTNATEEINSGHDAYTEADGLRLLFTTCLFFLPFTLSLLGLSGAICNKGALSMLMALSFCSLACFFLLFSSVFIVVSMPLVDHCPIIEDMVHELLGNHTISYQSAIDSEFVVMEQHNSTLIEIFDYFSLCIGVPPPIFNAIGPHQVSEFLNRSDANITTRIYELEHPANPDERIVLRPVLRSLADAIWSLVPSLDAIVYLIKGLVSCQKISPIYISFRKGLCTDWAGAFALTATLLFLVGICMIPAACVGIVGYKRFNKRWTRDYQVHPQSEFDEDEAPYRDEPGEEDAAKHIRGGEPYSNGEGIEMTSHMGSGGGVMRPSVINVSVHSPSAPPPQGVMFK